MVRFEDPTKCDNVARIYEKEVVPAALKNSGVAALGCPSNREIPCKLYRQQNCGVVLLQLSSPAKRWQLHARLLRLLDPVLDTRVSADVLAPGPIDLGFQGALIGSAKCGEF